MLGVRYSFEEIIHFSQWILSKRRWRSPFGSGFANFRGTPQNTGMDIRSRLSRSVPAVVEFDAAVCLYSTNMYLTFNLPADTLRNYVSAEPDPPPSDVA